MMVVVPGCRTVVAEMRRAAGRGFDPACVSTAGPGVERAPNPAAARMRGTWKPRHGPVLVHR
jgi:hypothetical protein